MLVTPNFSLYAIATLIFGKCTATAAATAAATPAATPKTIESKMFIG